MLLDILLLCILASLNGVRARRKGKAPWLWGFLTILAFFVFTVIGELIVLGFFYRGPLTVGDVQNFFVTNIMLLIFCLASGFGGFLLIRYILDRKPDITSEE